MTPPTPLNEQGKGAEGRMHAVEQIEQIIHAAAKKLSEPKQDKDTTNE